MTMDDRAKLAAQIAGHASMWLYAAALTEDKAEKRRMLARGFKSWSLAARNMGLLEQLAPNCAREGFEEAAKIADFVEARAE
jgi:hypothetical protein